MNRRRFLTGTLVGAAALGEGRPLTAQEKKAPRSALMKAGHQHRSSDEDLRVLAAFGVKHICSALPSRTFDDNWSVKGLTHLRGRVEKFGIKLDMVPLPLSSSPISRAEYPAIMLGKDPERDRALDDICTMIRNAAEAGIPAVKYNLTILGVARTESKPGRGGARCSSFVWDEAKDRDDEPPAESGAVSAEKMWERIGYFLKRVVPVAEKHKSGCAVIRTTPACRRQGLSRRVSRPRLGGGVKEIRRHRGEQVSRPELLPGFGG